jgi:hypothetical protein
MGMLLHLKGRQAAPSGTGFPAAFRLFDVPGDELPYRMTHYWRRGGRASTPAPGVTPTVPVGTRLLAPPP